MSDMVVQISLNEDEFSALVAAVKFQAAMAAMKDPEAAEKVWEPLLKKIESHRAWF